MRVVGRTVRGAVGAVALLAASALAGCDSGSDPVESDGDGIELTVSIADDETDPSGQVVRVEQGEEITVSITSDVDDEIHVHSEPDHSFPVAAGQEVVETFSIDSPGTFPMESHRLESVIVKFEVQ